MICPVPAGHTRSRSGTVAFAATIVCGVTSTAMRSRIPAGRASPEMPGFAASIAAAVVPNWSATEATVSPRRVTYSTKTCTGICSGVPGTSLVKSTVGFAAWTAAGSASNSSAMLASVSPPLVV